MNSNSKPNESEIKFEVTASEAAGKILSPDEVQMLVKFLLPGFADHPHKNAFGFPKLGIWVIRHDNKLFIVTDEEKKKNG